DVTDEDVWLPLFDEPESLQRRADHPHVRSRRFEHRGEQIALVRLVIDDEDLHAVKPLGRADLGWLGPGLQRHGPDREQHPERRPLALALALGGDLAAMELHQVADDGEANSQTAG